jgi:hypothetical protein
MIEEITNNLTGITTMVEVPEVVYPDMPVVVEQPTVEDRLDAIEAVLREPSGSLLI